jgi:large subunit ribosomal protein L32
MAALPKRKSSSARRDRRRSAQAIISPALSTCPKCKKTKRAHFVCSYCGYYGKGEKAKETSTK